jgi:hypothetical protein
MVFFANASNQALLCLTGLRRLAVGTRQHTGIPFGNIIGVLERF